MTHTLYAGCSYTAGVGFDLAKDDNNLWVNQLHQQIFSHTVKLNVSASGRSNAGIFQDTVRTLLTLPVSYALVQWTSIPRYEVHLGFELYSTKQVFSPYVQCHDVKTNSGNYSAEYLNSVRDRFVTLVHDFYELVNLVDYVNIIINTAKRTNTKVFFINGLCPWDENFFARKHNCLPNEYTHYTQTLLNSKFRDDEEVFELYNKMHNTFDQLGSIHTAQWINLYHSMRNHQVDVNNDLAHPGIKSNQVYVDMFATTLQQLL